MFSARGRRSSSILGQKNFSTQLGATVVAALFAFATLQESQAQSLTAKAGALARGTNHEVSISFSAPVDDASATDPAHYSIPPGTIEDIRLVPLANAAILTVSGLITSDSYTLTVSNVTAIDANTAPITQTNLTFNTRDMTWAGIGRNETGIPQEVVAIGTNAFTLVSGALTFFSSQDGFSYEEATFAYETISGDFDRAVQVEYQDVGSQWSRAGVMVREGVDEDKERQTDPGDPTQAFSRYQAVQVNPAVQFDGTPANNLYEINRRLTPGGATDEPEITNNAAPAYPNAWVRLARSGSTFRMYRSDTGTNWTKLGETTFDPPFATN